ncbi:FAD-dependent oxidoreductase [Saccharospirillum impatiens]|uniref:FAD-dependent oxidoreductase n=1 Tax=Saccharospirillum impatiens TaxID=169438 RepID=UPI0004193694|nr:FAD-dependent oxidoreductase [Saccharospirillum impatiens]
MKASSAPTPPLIVIGSGLAAYTLVREWRKADTETPMVLITADDGAGYSKPMLSNAHSKGQSADDLIQLTAEAVAERYQAEVLTRTEVLHIDPTTRTLHLDNGSTLVWGQLVLAVGAEPIQAPLEGDALNRVFSVNDRLDFARLQSELQGARQVTIMGAGLIGCEFANDLVSAGFEVDLVAPSETLLSGLVPAEVGDALKQALMDAGVKFHLGPLLSRVDRSQSGKLQVSLTNGQKFATDLVLSAVGLLPRLDLARKAGLAVNRGIQVNKYLQTSDPSIYALGDCAEVEGLVLMYVMPLMNAARALAKTLAGEPTAVQWPAMPVTVKTPACPVIAYPPRSTGAWQIDGSGANLAAVCREGESIVGFALTGERIKERNTWLKAVPPLLAS